MRVRKTHQRMVNRLVKDTQKYRDEMGQTGEGIASADQINMDVRNEFTNKWGQYYAVDAELHKLT